MKTEAGRERSQLLLLLTTITCVSWPESANTSITSCKETQNLNESEFHTWGNRQLYIWIWHSELCKNTTLHTYRLLNALPWKPVHGLYAKNKGKLVVLTGRVFHLSYRSQKEYNSPKVFFYEEGNQDALGMDLWGIYNERNALFESQRNYHFPQIGKRKWLWNSSNHAK